MFIHITFNDGSNPYIAKTNKAFFDIISKYYIYQTTEKEYAVDGKMQILTATGKKLSSREKAKASLRDFAIQWQYDFANYNYSYSDLAMYTDFFNEYGKKYGLIREFRENGIL